MSTSALSTAIHHYHQLLEKDSILARASAEQLAARQPEALVTFGGKPLCSVLRPQFLTPQTYASIQRVCSILARAMFRLAGRIPEDPELVRLLALTPIEQDLVSIDPGFREISPTSRLDSFMAGDTWKFVEYNAETPAAIAYEDVLSEIFQTLPIMQAFSRTHTVLPLPARHRLLETLLEAYRQWGGTASPVIAIVDWSGLPTASEFVLFSDYFRAAGLRALIVEPSQLSYDGQRLRADGEGIDLVYRRILAAELLAHPDLAEPLVRAYRAHHVCVVNSFRSKLLHKKAIFALLSDERYSHYFNEDERVAIAAHIPWTRRVQEDRTTHDGCPVDLLPYIVDNRDRLLLKPNDEYGGKGVVIGWERTQSEWEIALKEALQTPFVVQERVPISREPFPVWHDGGLVWPQLAADLDPFLFQSEVTGVLTQLSAASLLNVTAGTGSTAPTFLVG